MGDLMKMGIPALNAMAQGQQNSIAPPYLILAALKALTDQQKGMGAAAPQGTVKDQILAQTRPTIQTGIGAMAPPGAMVPQQPQGFADGGPVESIMWGAYGTETPEETEARGVAAKQKLFDWLRGKGAASADWLRGKGTVYERANSLPATQATQSTSDYGNEGTRSVSGGPNYGHENRRVVQPSVPTPPPTLNIPTDSSARVSSSIRGGVGAGIGSTGANPLPKYGPDTVQMKNLADMQGMNAPANTQLDEAIKKYSTPDEARLAEMMQEKKMAGLGALAKGIMKGRGFGAAFGPAAADSVAAEAAEAQKIREYKDKREAIATELGLKKGSENYDRFVKDIDFKRNERATDYAEAVRKQARGDELTKNERHDIFEQKKIDVDVMKIQAHLAEVREMAMARNDNKILMQLNAISAGRALAADRAEKQTLGRYEKLPQYLGDPEMQRRARNEAADAVGQAEKDYMLSMKPILEKMGIPVP
jgi:hypothetical protein